MLAEFKNEKILRFAQYDTFDTFINCHSDPAFGGEESQ